MIERLRAYTVEAGRPADAVGVEAFLSIAKVPRERWAAHVEAWRDAGATHLTVSTIGAGLASPQAHIDAFRQAFEIIAAA